MRPFSPAARVLPGSAPRRATPVKSILKTASVLGNRKHQHEASSDTPDIPESPTKRRKVFFDDIRNVTYEVGHRTMEEVKLEVRTALEGHLRGHDSQYDTLKEMFSSDRHRLSPSAVSEDDDALKPHELQAYVMALTSCVSTLKKKDCNGLVRVILNCSWLGKDDAFAKSFTHFLAALVSAQGSYLGTVLSMIVDKFQLTRQSKWCVPDSPEVARETMRERLHYALQYLLQMFPSAVGVLSSLLSAKFPFPDDSVQTHMAYINNLLKVREYVPKLENEILDTILNRAVKIDSQMQLDLEDMDDETTTAVLLALRENPHTTSDWEEDELDESDNESVDSEDLDLDEETTRIKTVKGNVEKMDAVLDTLFKFFTPYFLNPGSDKAFDAFAIILREFDQIVLPTYKSRHTQFLIFHFAQQHERLTDAFCGQLITTAFQNDTPNVLKQAAAAYLASFVARGAQVPRNLVRGIFSLLLVHIENYRRKYEPTCRGPDLKRFHSYYSLVQAILYIFCFRWQDLIVAAPDTVDADDAASYIGQDLEWVGSSRKDLSIQIFCKLNPLKVCAPVIVEEFAKLAHRLGFMYIYPLVESNKRVRLTQFLSSAYGTGSALREVGYDQEESFHQLDPYFPFDPYQLPVSKRWLDNDYVQWKSVPGLNADEDSDDMDDEDDNELEEATATDSEGGDYD